MTKQARLRSLMNDFKNRIFLEHVELLFQNLNIKSQKCSFFLIFEDLFKERHKNNINKNFFSSVPN